MEPLTFADLRVCSDCLHSMLDRNTSGWEDEAIQAVIEKIDDFFSSVKIPLPVEKPCV